MTVSSRAFAAMLKIGPPVTRAVSVERDVPVRAPDGADLLTDVYLARARDPLPVIMMRTPYGRRGPYGTIARLFAERGYQAVIQSTRGTSGSGGQIDYDCEAADGRATADWIIKQPLALAAPVPPAGEPSRYTYDSADATPAVGGTSSRPANAGPKDNRELERRPDVLTYTSEPLPSAMEITGPVTAELFVSSSRPHTDFFARLCDVDQKGRSVNITDGLIRLTSASPQPQQIRIDLWPNAHQFRPGHQVRLQVSSGAHPRYARNTGSGEPLATAAILCAAQQAVHHDPAHPSAVLLPVVLQG